MNIGIITWFKYENYGTKLQALALQEYLKKDGHSVVLIDFVIPETDKKKVRESFLSIFKRKIKYCIKNIAENKNREKINIRSKKFIKIIREKCQITESIETDKKFIDVCNRFDLIICGSDQIWNPNWYHPYYFANFNEIFTRKISYAPSIGVTKIDNLIVDKIKVALKEFDYITVRETTAAELLESITGIKPEIVVDPTMLLSRKEWQSFLSIKNNANKEKKYILCYFLTDNLNHWHAVKKFAYEKGLEMHIIPQEGISFFIKAITYADAGVKEFLELISNAEYILTDSYHAILFSLIFEKQFYVFERFDNRNKTSQNSRIYEMLNRLDINDHKVLYNKRKIIESGFINYDNVSKKLKKMITESKEILETALNK